jgi:Protein of unknown function (DUF1161)
MRGAEKYGLVTLHHPDSPWRYDMKKLIVVALMVVFVTPLFATKSCEELKSEIDAKLQAKGIKNYTLDILSNENVKEGKIVGSCDGGTKKIVYKKK